MKREGAEDISVLEVLYNELNKDYLSLLKEEKISKLGDMITLSEVMQETIPQRISELKSHEYIGNEQKRDYISDILTQMAEMAELIEFYRF